MTYGTEIYFYSRIITSGEYDSVMRTISNWRILKTSIDHFWYTSSYKHLSALSLKRNYLLDRKTSHLSEIFFCKYLNQVIYSNCDCIIIYTNCFRNLIKFNNYKYYINNDEYEFYYYYYLSHTLKAFRKKSVINEVFINFLECF